jgi:hypothetical protein
MPKRGDSHKRENELVGEIFRMTVSNKMVRQISVFEAQEIGGKTVLPLCEPVDDDNISTSVAAATNLLWFAMNIALAQKDRSEAGKLARMIEGIVEIEVEDVPNKDDTDFEATMKMIDDALEEDDSGQNEEPEEDEDDA